MPSTIELAPVKQVDGCVRLLRIRGVDIFFHWSVLLIAAVILANAFSKFWLALVGGLSYIGVILLHECGHMYAAQRLGCWVHAIHLYPIHGTCRFEAPWTRFDQSLIAFAGVVAQAIIFIPAVAWIIAFGYTRYEPLNAFLALFGGFSMLIACFNLMPFRGLDGAVAWQIFPEYFRRRRLRIVRRR
jgi:Zn-dependent protease